MPPGDVKTTGKDFIILKPRPSSRKGVLNTSGMLGGHGRGLMGPMLVHGRREQFPELLAERLVVSNRLARYASPLPDTLVLL